MEKRGKIKYTDPEKGYGYIVDDEAQGPAETILFEQVDTVSEMDELVPGVEVVYEVDDDSKSAAQAKQVRTA